MACDESNTLAVQKIKELGIIGQELEII